jgi:cation diffusion facilitator CzcD-associated flavoprotein CzcO
LWRVRTDNGEDVTAHYLITAVGTLSDTNLPPFKGLEKFRGKWCHTSRFPRGGIDFTAKRVAVVGTGATAVQAIPEIAQQAKQLTRFIHWVFERAVPRRVESVVLRGVGNAAVGV